MLLYGKQLEKKKEWNEENVKLLKNYILKKLAAEDIARMMDMTVEKIKTQSEKIVNPNTQPIKGSKPYKDKTDEEHPTFIPPFVMATIGIDKDD